MVIKHYFWKDRWFSDCSLQSIYLILHDLALNKNATVAQVIGYNKYYLIFTRSLNEILRQQLHTLYIELSNVTFNAYEDICIWRWNTNEIFSTKSCYSWIEFGGVRHSSFNSIWSAYIPLKIKIFLWLVKQNKILTKDNLARKGWIGNQQCIFCQCSETVEHLFIHCSNSLCIWTWIARYNNFNFNCSTIDDLWQLNAYIPFKDDNICEMVRGAVTWVIWKE
jgi:zinc-binding in reverse transcriptase